MARYRTIDVFSDGTTEVSVVVRIDLSTSGTKTGVRLYGEIEPVAIILRTPGGTDAFDIEGRRVEIGDLAPELVS